jgi:hypothetical protein
MFTNFHGAIAPLADFGVAPVHTEILSPSGRKRSFPPDPLMYISKMQGISEIEKKQKKVRSQAFAGTICCSGIRASDLYPSPEKGVSLAAM